MVDYCHQVSGVFTRRSQADSVKQDLLGLGIRRERVRILDQQELARPKALRGTQRPLWRLFQGGAIGMLFGLLVSVLFAVAMTKTGAGLFSGTPLVLLGWGTLLGCVGGAMLGASANASQRAHPFGYTLLPGNVILLAETHSERETTRARDIIEASPGVGAHMDISLI